MDERSVFWDDLERGLKNDPTFRREFFAESRRIAEIDAKREEAAVAKVLADAQRLSLISLIIFFGLVIPALIGLWFLLTS